MKNLTMIMALVGALALVACGKSGGDGGGGEGAAKKEGGVQMSAEAASKWNNLCVNCHGKDGKGDGPGAANLNPKPRDYTDAEWQKKVTDKEIKEIIIKGGAAVGKSKDMPPNPDLVAKPGVVKELIAKIRSFNPAK